MTRAAAGTPRAATTKDSDDETVEIHQSTDGGRSRGAPCTSSTFVCHAGSPSAMDVRFARLRP